MWRRLVWAPEDGQVDVDGWAPYTPLPQSKLGATWSDAGEGDSDLSKAVGLVLYPLPQLLPIFVLPFYQSPTLLLGPLSSVKSLVIKTTLTEVSLP